MRPEFTDKIKFIFFACLCSCITLVCGSQFAGYPVILEISTTSDWTKINFENTSFYYLNDTLLSNKQNNPVELGIFSIRKKSYDSSFVQERFEGFFPNKLPQIIKFSIRKGAIGETKAVFRTQFETLALFTAIKPENKFILNRNVLQKIPIQYYQLSSKNIKIEPLVLAFYFPWYEKNWLQGDSQLVPHKPIIGFYNSSDEKVLQKHISIAKNSKIDGFITSWWGKNSITDSNLKKIILICENLGFKFTLYLETAKSIKDLKNDLDYIETTYAQSPSFVTLEDRPVLFIYSRILDELSLDSLKTIKSKFALINYGYSLSNLKNFAGFHEYLPPGNDLTMIKQNYLIASQIAQRKNKLIAVTVMPGYDDRRIRNPGNFTSRDGGTYYKGTWKAALACNPDWVLITSFNEWFEGTEIEPSKEYGNLYLDLTSHYAQQFRKNKK